MKTPFLSVAFSRAYFFFSVLKPIKHALPFFLFILLFSRLQAQSDHIPSYVGVPGKNDVSHKIIYTLDNNYLMAGQVNGDAALYKFDCNGQLVDSLRKSLPGGNGIEAFMDVVELPDGNFIAAGLADAAVGKVVAVIRVDADLNEMVFDTFRIFGKGASASNLLLTPAGNLYLSGIVGGFSFDFHNIFCMRIDPGNLQPVDSITEFSYQIGVDWLASVSLANDGDLIFSGVSTINNLFSCENLLENYAYVRKVKPNGALVWQHVRAATFKNDYGRAAYTSAIQDSTTGNILAVGSRYTGNETHPLDVVYMLLSSAGTVLDSHIVEMPGSQYIFQTIQYSDPNLAFISVGDSSSAFRCPLDGVKDAAMLFIRVTLENDQINTVQVTTAQGTHASLRSIASAPATRFSWTGVVYEPPGTANNENILVAIQKIGVTVQQSGNMLSVVSTNPPGSYNYQWYLNGQAIPGATGSSVLITGNGDYTVSVTDPDGCGGSDIFTGTGTIEIRDFRFYPNPFSDALTIEGMPQEPLSVALLDLTGRTLRLLEPHWTGNAMTFHEPALPPGMYLLKMASSKGVQVWKLVKE